MPVKEQVAIRLLRREGIAPHLEPVSFGVPFAKGQIATTNGIGVFDAAGRTLPCQVAPLAHWSDHSVRWALVHTIIQTTGSASESITLSVDGEHPCAAPASEMLRHGGHRYTVDAGAAVWTVPCGALLPFLTVDVGGQRVPARLKLVCDDRRGRRLTAHMVHWQIDEHGDIRATLHGSGELRTPNGGALCHCDLRVTFFHGLALQRIQLTLHNPRRARHRGGVWDLGDAGSIFVRSLGLRIELDRTPGGGIQYCAAPGSPLRDCGAGPVTLQQASSGGERWDARTHVDRYGRVPLAFRGCRITMPGGGEQIDRPSPVLSHTGTAMRTSVALTHFWQKFPSVLRADAGGLWIGMTSPGPDDVLELQGGERLTRTIYVLFTPTDVAAQPHRDIEWVHDPLVAALPPAYVAGTGAMKHCVPVERDSNLAYCQLVEAAVAGPQSFFAKREVIDEYGWRNFGEVYADHEDVYFTGAHPVISHYNNQYDLVHGLLLHFARTADRRWFELGDDLARHVVDIDIYHTTEDKPAYNGGLFWHTEHYQGAGRATHRSYSAESANARHGAAYGGGPGNEHNYATGLLYHYYFTGDPRSATAVRQLADWVIAMDDGSQSLLGDIDGGPTGLASCTRTPGYHGPGRGAGNSISVLIDAFDLTRGRHYLAKAEELIQRCAHPADDPEAIHLTDAEARWSYVVFLQALGKYLDCMRELGELDRCFAYAQAVLLRYAGWMLDNERPYLQRPGIEYPTETWPAQDIRKSCVFDLAAQHAPSPALRQVYRAQARAVYDDALGSVMGFETRSCTRALAVLLVNGAPRAAADVQPAATSIAGPPPTCFGAPSNFRSQRERVARRLRTPSGLLALARMLARPRVWRRLLAGELW